MIMNLGVDGYQMVLGNDCILLSPAVPKLFRVGEHLVTQASNTIC